MTLKLYTSVAKELKLKVKKFFWGVVPTFVEGTRKKLVKCPPPIPILKIHKKTPLLESLFERGSGTCYFL